MISPEPTELTAAAQGVYPIAPTPFFEDRRIDTASIDRLLDFYLQIGATGLTVLGQWGEAPKLTLRESVEVAKRMVQRAPQLPVIVGYCRQAVEALGSDVPFVLQDYPLTFLVQMTPAVISRIAEALPSCVMLKHEDWPWLQKFSAPRKFERDGGMRHIAILCGNNGLFLDLEMARGADGANTGYAFPDRLCDVVRLSTSGQRDEAHDLFDAHLPFLRYEQQPSLGLASFVRALIEPSFLPAAPKELAVLVGLFRPLNAASGALAAVPPADTGAPWM